MRGVRREVSGRGEEGRGVGGVSERGEEGRGVGGMRRGGEWER